ncbi:MAG TPA: lysophospholipid acyltransferase family protein [Polyangiaceae bacterium]|jgi:KDO2-lipid IV(A) lauroyltransferase
MTALLRALALLAGAMSWRALGVAGTIVGWLAGGVLRIRRAHVEEAMRAAKIADPVREAAAMYRALGTSAWELLRVARRDDAVDRAVFEPASEARWQGALAGGRGVVVAASHTGNWDLTACRVARETELLVVTKRLRARGVDRFWQETRAARGVRLSDALGAVGRARAVLGRGGAVAMMIDQVPADTKHAVEAEFLGRRALVDRAPAVLAASRRVPLVVAASRRDADGRTVIVVLDVLEPPARASRRWARDATIAATSALEAFVRAHPSQWLWLHRRWRMPAPTLDRAPRGAMLRARCPTPAIPSSSRAGASKAASSSAPASTRT